MPEIQPTINHVRGVLRDAGLALAGTPDLSFLDDGWDFWAFRAGDTVVRLPKRPSDPLTIERLMRESRVVHLLAPRLHLPISVPELHSTATGVVFSTHRMVPGVPLRDLKHPAAPGFGAALGRFLRALHETPVEDVAGLGVRFVDGAQLREYQIEDWEKTVRRVFPLISCEARTYTTTLFEGFVGDELTYNYEPRLTHHDIDERNVLADPQTGELSGVIDFGDVSLNNPAGDFFWAYTGGFERIGIADQLDDLLQEGGVDEAKLSGAHAYVNVFWRLNDIIHGLDIEDDDVVREGIEALNHVVPFGVKC